MVSIDYHIQVDDLYSVPYQLIHDLVEVRFTTTTVEIYVEGDGGSPRISAEWPAVQDMPQSHRLTPNGPLPG